MEVLQLTPSNIILSEGRDCFPELEFAHGNEIKEMIPLPPWFFWQEKAVENNPPFLSAQPLQH